MLVLTIFAFLAGIVTILSPCILPILPVILASSVADKASQKRPYGIVVGFVLSFTFFTLFLSSIVRVLGISADSMRTFSVIVIAVFGFSLIIPRVQLILESLFTRLANLLPSTAGRSGFGGGLVIGLSLGLLWTPCVGPILASVISLAISGTVTAQAMILTFFYSLGTAIPMYLIILGGNRALTRVPWLLRNSRNIQRGFGIIMILTSIMLAFGYDRQFQTYVLTKIPSYGAGLTKLEDNKLVSERLGNMGTASIAAPELILGGEWFNLSGDPLSIAGLKGKVVLIDFWTYTCINCQRTFPYLKSWHTKYQDDGLVIIGVHSPEFEFEKDTDNVKEAIKDFGIEYPIMQDNDFATWRAYSNRYWPAKYLIDSKGIIRYTHFGEGDYDETEKMIQSLLQEAGIEVNEKIDNPSYKTYGRTPEIYLGTARYNPLDPVSKTGKWGGSAEYARPGVGSSLKLYFEAKSAYLVMRPVDPAKSSEVRVYLDDQFVKTIAVTSDKLYTLVDMDESGKHEIKLEFPGGDIELFAFTFG